MNATAGTRWDRAPASPRASAGVVDVWRADLAAADGLAELLCAQERARAERLLRATLWARSRGMLRALLGRYLDRDPRGLRFELGPQGKPALRGRAGRARQLRFNLSHSGELALVAVTAGREVGVDVECAPRARRVHELAIVARVLGPAQAMAARARAGCARVRVPACVDPARGDREVRGNGPRVHAPPDARRFGDRTVDGDARRRPAGGRGGGRPGGGVVDGGARRGPAGGRGGSGGGSRGARAALLSMAWLSPRRGAGERPRSAHPRASQRSAL